MLKPYTPSETPTVVVPVDSDERLIECLACGWIQAKQDIHYACVACYNVSLRYVTIGDLPKCDVCVYKCIEERSGMCSEQTWPMHMLRAVRLHRKHAHNAVGGRDGRCFFHTERE